MQHKPQIAHRERRRRLHDAVAVLLGSEMPIARFDRITEAYAAGERAAMEEFSAWDHAEQKGRSPGLAAEQAARRYKCRYEREDLIAAYRKGKREAFASIMEGWDL
jgi:hypothetical protein